MVRKTNSFIALLLILSMLFCACEYLPGTKEKDTTDVDNDAIVDEYKCATCKDAGILKCDKCDGDAKFKCTDCKATGKVTCSKCDGTGKQNCVICHGKGYISSIGSPNKTCRVCYGQGKIDCSETEDCACNNGIWYCKKCNFKGTIDCPDC